MFPKKSSPTCKIESKLNSQHAVHWFYLAVSKPKICANADNLWKSIRDTLQVPKYSVPANKHFDLNSRILSAICRRIKFRLPNEFGS